MGRRGGRTEASLCAQADDMAAHAVRVAVVAGGDQRLEGVGVGALVPGIVSRRVTALARGGADKCSPLWFRESRHLLEEILAVDTSEIASQQRAGCRIVGPLRAQ